MEKTTKDNWDKAEIIGKILAGVLVPIIVGVSVWIWNYQRASRDTSVQMVAVAVGILSQKPDTSGSASIALRQWAIEVLKSPAAPPTLTAAAARELEFENLGYFWGSSGLNEKKLLLDSPDPAPSPPFVKDPPKN